MFDNDVEDEGGDGSVIIPAVLIAITIVLIIAISISIYATQLAT